MYEERVSSDQRPWTRHICIYIQTCIHPYSLKFTLAVPSHDPDSRRLAPSSQDSEMTPWPCPTSRRRRRPCWWCVVLRW